MNAKELTRVNGAARMGQVSCAALFLACLWGASGGAGGGVGFLPAAMVAPLWLRSLRLGVWAGPQGVLVRSWFANHWAPAEMIHRVRGANYDGAFSVGGSSALLNVIAIEVSAGAHVDCIDFSATIGTPRGVARRVLRIKDLVRNDDES